MLMSLLHGLIEHKGKAIGILLGLIVGILFLTLHFFKTIILLLCIGIGWLVGLYFDDARSFQRIIAFIFRRKMDR